MAAQKNWMIYGAYGYSGELIATEAKRRGMKPILAGRDAARLSAVADKLGLEAVSFELSSPEKIAGYLENIDFVFHCAGPFAFTAQPMIKACLASKTHYFDITGEIDVFEFAHSSMVNQQAREAGVIVCPGIGFDVVPTDCIARILHDEMPDGKDLKLGFFAGPALSPGTAKTTLNGLRSGTRVRKRGQIQRVGFKFRKVDFGEGKEGAIRVAWGDVSTAYYSTGIPNIEVYMKASKKLRRSLRIAQVLSPLLRFSQLFDYLNRKIDTGVVGPPQHVRQKYRSQVCGQIRNEAGDVISAFLQAPNGYDVTVYSPLAIAEHLIMDEVESCGSLTPSLLMGKNFASSLPDTTQVILKKEAAFF